ncbi:preprotein translocase subunit SecD [Methylomarinovum caldicuralii]|uniref:Protein translocase subunit SecD n=1 Tax=Methylomarinovum caldicuralii TaxID=438856 RepID=A0AAU9C8P8_9GAMM|nr:protein translocase subunit SecD [Methylomarinovum caldicuralii]BCX81846.1 preprotein translocase subunit SecD [Methylomarinovum caldicuralii]
MQNRFPLWKNVLIVLVLLIGLIYALPNLFGEDPAVQISPQRGAAVDESLVVRVGKILREAQIPPKSIERQEGRLLIRFPNTDAQLKAADLLRERLGDDYVVALNLAPSTPGWLQALGAKPMYLGLDLRGGVHFLLEVDMDAAIDQALERYQSDIRATLRESKIRYLGVQREGRAIVVKFRSRGDLDRAQAVLEKNFRQLVIKPDAEALQLTVQLSQAEEKEIRRFALKQNLTTLRNRVNELGVAEPVIQQQGENRIVVQLPGVQDTTRAKEILGATATLEFRLVDTEHDVEAALQGHPPIGAKLYRTRDGRPVLLKRQVIVTGDQIVDASSGFDQQSGTPAVFVTLDSVGAKRMAKVTRENIGKPMAVVFIENRIETKKVDGKTVKVRKRVEEVINVATIRGRFSKRFQITGLNSTEEARNLALLLRAGALAAPIDIVEERTVGPSLGKDNIERGFLSVIVGFTLVLVFMAWYYKLFGLVADVALFFNLVLLIAILSLLQATLTMPGIAGIVLTVGMAVDANVLIFERIKEELRNGNSPQASIYSGYEKAFATIFDANITTLIAALVLFSFGTGPIKGFAVTLSIGIMTSMFTAILVTRMLINWIYGGRRVAKLAI